MFEPKDVTEAITYGFDPELNLKPSQRAAKRRRIERYAEIYINGGQLAVASAILRGPFGQGWVNPWQSYVNLGENALNNGARSCPERVDNSWKKRTYKKKPSEETAFVENSAPRSNYRRRPDRQRSANLDKAKSSVPKSKNISVRDKSTTNRRTKQKKAQGEVGAACQVEERNISIEKENSFVPGTEKTSKKIWTNKDCNITHNGLLAKNKDKVGNITNDSNESELANKAKSAHNCQFPTIRKPTAAKKLKSTRLDDCMLQQDTVKKYMGSARKAISRKQLEEDLCNSTTASGIGTNLNKRISMNAICNIDGGGKDDVPFSDSATAFALRCSESRASDHLDQVYSEPAGPEKHIKASSAAVERSRSSPIFKSTSANDVREIRENLLLEKVTKERSIIYRNNPRYMIFNSPNLSPIVANDGKRHSSTARQPAQNSFNDKEVHVDKRIMNSHRDKGESLSDQIQSRTKAKEISLQAAGSRATSEARARYEIAGEVSRRDSFYGCKSISSVSEHDKSLVNIHRKISSNNPLSIDFSTQKALVAAQDAFQNELTRKECSLIPNEEAHLALQNENHEKSVTPFANFRAKFDGSHSLLHPTPQMSTQELFEMVSPLTFSSAAKPAVGNSAYLTSSPSKQCKGDSRNADQKSSSHQNDIQVKASVKSGPQAPAFSISSNGLLHEVSEHSQQYDPNVEVEAVLDDANSFLRSWDLESELKGISKSKMANREEGKYVASFSKHG